jgi:formate/nitrite transporter FocA (FNT family)
MLVQVIQGGSGTLRTDYPGLITLVAAFFFPVGLIMLVLTGQDLCTANFMVVPMAWMKGRVRLWEIPVNWIFVFFGNLAGALTFVAFLAHWSGLYTSGMITYSIAVAVNKSNQGWGECFLRGIGCNFLGEPTTYLPYFQADQSVCMAVLLGTGAREMVSKIAALHFPVFVFVILGFEHVIV